MSVCSDGNKAPVSRRECPPSTAVLPVGAQALRHGDRPAADGTLDQRCVRGSQRPRRPSDWGSSFRVPSRPGAAPTSCNDGLVSRLPPCSRSRRAGERSQTSTNSGTGNVLPGRLAMMRASSRFSGWRQPMRSVTASCVIEQSAGGLCVPRPPASRPSWPLLRRVRHARRQAAQSPLDRESS